MRQNKKSDIERVVHWIADAMAGWRFAALAVCILVFFTLFLIAVLMIPTGESGIGAFARDVRTWCFNYDPATGEMDWFYVTVMLSKPLVIAAAVAVVWHRQLIGALRGVCGELALVAGIALIGVGLVAVTFFVVGEPNAEVDGEYPFPAERIRTEIEPPEFRLQDHTGEKLSLADLEGKVVVVTAVYATCWDSCPLILTQLREVTEAIGADAEDLVVVGITLDPEQDDEELLTNLADRHRVGAPQYRLVHGDPDEVNRVLDEFSVARTLDEERGEIDHANLFIVIDRSGSIAYRITLGDRTESWLTRAIEILLAEQ